MEHDEPESDVRGPTVSEIGERLREDLHALFGAAGRRRDDLSGLVRRFMDEHPFATIGVAFGAGYVLAGGLFSRATVRVLKVGARMYFGHLVRGAVGGTFDGFLGMPPFERGGDGASSRTAH